jgi:hypothetical protein
VSDRSALAGRLRRQSRACQELGSPLYASLLAGAADDVEAGGPTWAVLRGREGPPGSVPALRLMGAVRRLALAGEASRLGPWLAP